MSKALLQRIVPVRHVNKPRRWLLLGFASVMLSIFSSQSGAQQLWFAPPDNLPRGVKKFNDDFPQFWTSPDSWKLTASHISAFNLTPMYAAAAPEAELRRVSAFLSSKHIAIAVQMHALPVDNCGRGVEGMTKAGRPGDIARRLKAAGVDVAYFTLDEPLYYGSIFTGRDACRYSLEEVAHRLSGTIKDLSAVYPNAKIVEWEPTTSQPLSEWKTTLHRWLNSYRLETGTPLYAMGMDSDWLKPWQSADSESAAILHQNGAKAGMFLDANGGPTVTDQSWMAETQKHIAAVQAAKLNLDFVIVASWTQHPWRNLPESDPLALSSLIPWYMGNRNSEQGR